jgi:radical SAM superfamily enzyme YgiQ (UPF0313 family)
MVDIIIISVPGITRKLPQAAPALLKGSVEAAGFTCSTIDFNIRFYQEIENSSSLETYFATGLNTEEHDRACELVETWTKDILKLNPKFIGISVFTYQNRIATKLFCQQIRKLSDVKIILGGQGLSDGGILGASGFGKQMYNEKLADFWIRSEGEISLVELLKNNLDYPGINSDTFKQIDDLDSIAFPNYDDYELHLYERRVLPITGSRGCVRACSFCDVHDHWDYRYRTGQNMASEVLHFNKQYNVREFNFTDSLINGNLKEFKKFTKILADHNNNNSNNTIKWTSQFIVRSGRQVNEQYWKDIADSGGKNLAIGVETGSDSVRLHMNKKFTNKDLDYTMTMLDKYNITCSFLMIVGYPTETDKDFQETLDLFTRYKKYTHIIRDINIGSTLGILPGTPLYYNSKELNIELDKYENNWVALDNPTLTIDQRIQRRKILKEHVLALGYTIPEDSSNHILQILEQQKDMFETRRKLKKMIRIKNATQES